MAKFTVVGLDDVMAQINRRTTKAVNKIPKMLEAGADVLIEAQKAEVDNMIYGSQVRAIGITSRSLGDLKKSVGKTKIQTDEMGNQYISIYPQGKDSKGVRNAEKGFQLEYGNSSFTGYPWMTAANTKSAIAVNEAILEVWLEDDSDKQENRSGIKQP